jgi:hypothetical protein
MRRRRCAGGAAFRATGRGAAFALRVAMDVISAQVACTTATGRAHRGSA